MISLHALQVEIKFGPRARLRSGFAQSLFGGVATAGIMTTMIRMLVADDAPFIREIVRHIAQANKIDLVGEAADGLEAVEMALRLKPDLVLMDIIMPNMSGIEATRQILAEQPTIRVVAFSTADQSSMVTRALEAGCHGFLAKPFASEDLLTAIRNGMKTK